MIEQKIRLLSEGLARAVDRRKFIKEASAAIFTGIAALASGHALVEGASADGGVAGRPKRVPECAPPGPYCNLNGVNEPNGCQGGSCFQHRFNNEVLQCRLSYIWGYKEAGCWSTKVAGGFWTCCDCECVGGGGSLTTYCGCAQFSADPPPRFDRPIL